MSTNASMSLVRYRVVGMDCSHCAAKIEKAARGLRGVGNVNVSIASQEMTLSPADADTLRSVERKITDLGYQLTRVREGPNEAGAILTTPAYNRALWIVVLLNLGYGMVEIAGGFVAGSQSVKADALDFLGDGIISLLGLIAIRWGLRARAQAALLQGVFLAALGIGVLVATLYRFFVLNEPHAELMGMLGAVGLMVNIASALVLLPHRSGDANVRAVWLFSRNDAIGNAAVVLASVVVWWTATPWPDLAVAVVVAGLFLHSAASIIRDAVNDLRTSAEIAGSSMSGNSR